VGLILLNSEKSSFESNTSTSGKRDSGSIKLIYNDLEKKSFTLNYVLKYFLTIFISIVAEYLIESYIIIFQDLDFWMLELFILWFLNTVYYKKQIYAHQIIAIISNLIPAGSKILSIYLSFLDDDNDYNGHLPVFYEDDYIVKISIGFTIYFFLILLRSIVNLRLKSYMDKDFISPNRIIITYGILGATISLIICIASNFISCTNTLKQIKNEDNTPIIPNVGETSVSDYICKVYSYKNSTYINGSYFENFEILLNNFKKSVHKEKYKEILVIIISII
jgi:hypothetical protein